MHSLRSVILIEGGLANTVRTALGVLKEDGWSGFESRIRSALSRNAQHDYSEWVRRYDTLDDADRGRIRQTISCMEQRPLISVLIPVFDPHPPWLEQAIDSVRHQLYGNWELCIADDASTNPEVRRVLERASAQDARIKAIYRPVNGHISAASNSALSLCTGRWVALMDHDDLLPEHALHCVAQTIVANPDAGVIYSDEDKVNERGLRFDPYFKSDFNRDLFYSHNMVSHLGVYRRDVIELAGGFREGYEGSQDYDLALRCLEHIGPRNVVHIPRVLYHWRKHRESTASGEGSKPYAADAAQRALESHLARTGVAAKVHRKPSGYHVHYAVSSPCPPVKVITWAEGPEDRRAARIAQIENLTDYPDYQVHLIDAGSGGAPRYPVNEAARSGDFEFVALLEPDVSLSSPDWLSELIAVAAQADVGAVSAKVLDAHGAVDHAGYLLGVCGFAGSAFHGQPGTAPCYFGRAGLMSAFSAVAGACLVLRRSAFLHIGGFDQGAQSAIGADVDLCLRLRDAGFRTVLNPSVVAKRAPWPNPGQAAPPHGAPHAEWQDLPDRWNECNPVDPLYNPNLTVERPDFSLAWPPRVAPL